MIMAEIDTNSGGNNGLKQAIGKSKAILKINTVGQERKDMKDLMTFFHESTEKIVYGNEMVEKSLRFKCNKKTISLEKSSKVPEI